ncbi:MAG: two pore domain potassium channel family protein [Flavobacteriales bacterium]|nr:two pore domain potassium channel family protein [Flavobacteriales bacterium]
MKKIIQKFVINENPTRKKNVKRVLQQRIENIKGIWNNDHQDDVGIEKLLRLFLAASQFLFPGIYIKHLFARFGYQVQAIVMDVFILFKVMFAFMIVYKGYQSDHILLGLVLYFLIETLLYVPTLIFASDIISNPSSYKRSIMLLFFNYLEIAFAFAVIYSHGHYLNMEFKHWFDPIYYSFATLSTIGYGDYYPVTFIGKVLMCSQALIFLSFVVLFINFFSNKMISKGYFGEEPQEKKES